MSTLFRWIDRGLGSTSRDTSTASKLNRPHGQTRTPRRRRFHLRIGRPPELRRQVPRVWPTTPSPPRGADRGRRARRRRISAAARLINYYRPERPTDARAVNQSIDFAPARTLITGGIYARPDVMLASRPIFSITRARCLASIPAPTSTTPSLSSRSGFQTNQLASYVRACMHTYTRYVPSLAAILSPSQHNIFF
jgi:hypothetical protein